MIKIEVRRRRMSATQGEAAVYINNERILSFNDDMYLKNNDGSFTNGFNTITEAKHYGDVVGGWGSIKPDSAFILGLLYHPYDKVYHYSDRVKDVVLNPNN